MISKVRTSPQIQHSECINFKTTNVNQSTVEHEQILAKNILAAVAQSVGTLC